MANLNKNVAKKYSSSKSARNAKLKEEGRGNKRYQKNRKSDGFEKENIRQRDSQSMNDITWYALNEQLLKDTSSIPYAWSTGLSMKQARSYAPIDNYVVPGIIAAHVSLSPLTLGTASDPVNVAARQLVGYIRSFNSGAKNYDANDLMIRLLAEGNFLAYLNFAVRAYATINMYSAYNRYMPKDLLIMQGLDPDDLRVNAANFRAALNTLISKAASILYIPSNLNIYKRWAWLFSNYYCDSNNPKDQLYLLTPTGYSKFVIDNETSMGKLEYVAMNNTTDDRPESARTLHKWTEIIAALNDMLDPLIEDQELCIMTGDMMKAYGPSSLSLQLVPESLTAIPVSDPLVLQQFKTSRSLPPRGGIGYDRDSRSIVQDEEAYYLTRSNDLLVPTEYDLPYISGGSTHVASGTDHAGREVLGLLASDAIIDSPNPNPTAVDNMENTRLMYMPLEWENVEEENVERVKVFTAGSEVLEYYSIGYRQYSGLNAYSFKQMFFTNTINMVDVPVGWVVPNTRDSFYYTVSQGQELLAMLENFDYSPTVYISFLALINNNEKLEYHHLYRRPHMRISNYALMPATMLEKMNNCALLSMFNITGFQPK